MKRTTKLLIGLLLFAVPFTATAVTVDPQLGATLTLGTADLEATIISIIQWLLGFLGLIAVIMILYGGFMWMTAAGNEDRVAKAKKIISAAVIGLIIILLAWAIVIFVVNQSEQLVN